MVTEKSLEQWMGDGFDAYFDGLNCRYIEEIGRQAAHAWQNGWFAAQKYAGKKFDSTESRGREWRLRTGDH